MAAGEDVPGTVAPPPGHPRFPLIDALRALAALAIVLVHTAIFAGVFSGAPYRGLVAHLDIGVAGFFLLSGFLLYRPFVAARELGAPAIGLRGYARRRALRILPAYWLALTVLAVVPGVYGAFSGNWWVYYGLLQNWPVYTRTGGCAVDGFKCGIAPAWSLAIEVLFYAALPFYAAATAALTRRLRGVGWVRVELVLLAAISVFSVLVQSLTISFSRWLFFSPLGRGWWFALGMGLAVLSVRAVQRGGLPRPLRWAAEHPGIVWGVAIAGYVVPSLWILDKGPQGAFPLGDTTQYTAEYVGFGLLCALVLLPAVFGPARSGWPRRVLATPLLAWLGLVSYGIFLWHFPIMLGLVEAGVLDWLPGLQYPVLVATTLAVTIPCAAASFYGVERPLMRRRRARPADVPPAALGAAAPELAAGTRASR